MTIAAGTKLGRYEIRSKIGAGGMGEVYLAQDAKLDRKVALKILPADVAADRSRMNRFVQEAKAASALNHPNIITIYEIDQSESDHFIATEFIDGRTLRDRLRTSPMNLREVLEVATQIAGALAAAHAAGIVHRDIKPENIMLRRDGIVKVLDFGLAKLTERVSPESVDAEAPTRVAVHTEPGVIMGTIEYMSPEQARGQTLDARSDIFSFGVVLYEMVGGRPPFAGESKSDVVASILNRAQPPLARYAPDVPDRLEEIVGKTLNKNPDERYQSAQDLLIDLKRLKQHLEVKAEIERTAAPEMLSVRSSDTQANLETRSAAMQPASGAERIVSGIKRHKVAIGLVSAALAIITVAVVLIYNRKATALTDKDTILLADWANTTGDTVFDGMLKQALAVQLEQSPFLNVFSEEQVRETLRLMNRSPDERVTGDIAREICQRQGLKALLSGSIASLGRNYVITLEAMNSQTGVVFARQQVEAESKEQVIKKLGEAATSLREKLGESLASIQKFDRPLAEATTKSLEALKDFSVGRELFRQGKREESIPFLKHAVERDANFALAYYLLGIVYGNGQRELALENFQKAFDLRDRTSEREKLLISSVYYGAVTGELDKDIEVLELIKQTYPRDLSARILLGFRYSDIGQYEKAIAEHREALRFNPNVANQYSGIANALVHLNRFDEARETCEQALSKKLDFPGYHRILFQLAFIRGDEAGMQQQVDWGNKTPDRFDHLNWQADAAAFSGQLRKARVISSQALGMAQQRGLKDQAANIMLGLTVTEALFGDCQSVKTDVLKSLAVVRTVNSLSDGARALALCGAVDEAELLATEIDKRFPMHTLAHAVALPMIRAAIEIRRGNSLAAIQALQSASRYELGLNIGLEPGYLRGLAYLHQGAGKEAATEFQKILDHRGVVAVAPLYPLADLGLARAAGLMGDTTKARKAYQDFFALWKDADADIQILIEAKAEYEKLK